MPEYDRHGLNLNKAREKQMKSKVMKLGLLTAMVMGGMNMAQAGNTVDVMGTVATVSCGVSVDRPNINLPVATPTVMKNGTVLKLVTSTETDLKVTLMNCTGTPDTVAAPKLRLSATGAEAGLGAGIFNTETGATFGIGVTSGGDTLISNLGSVSLGDKTTTAVQLENKETSFKVGLASSNLSAVSSGIAKTTLTFDYLYN
ncbi:MAG: hypothetical protein E7E83_04160 [Enterobacter ludwigii]|nr:hypothetical protein [Enterobacter ludwigii]